MRRIRDAEERTPEKRRKRRSERSSEPPPGGIGGAESTLMRNDAAEPRGGTGADRDDDREHDVDHRSVRSRRGWTIARRRRRLAHRLARRGHTALLRR